MSAQKMETDGGDVVQSYVKGGSRLNAKGHNASFYACKLYIVYMQRNIYTYKLLETNIQTIYTNISPTIIVLTVREKNVGGQDDSEHIKGSASVHDHNGFKMKQSRCYYSVGFQL